MDIELSAPRKTAKFLQDHVGLVNTTVLFLTATLSVLMDALRPIGPFLIVAAALSVAVLVLVVWRHRQNARAGSSPSLPAYQSLPVLAAGIATLVFSVSAVASQTHKEEGGWTASKIAALREWQLTKLEGIEKNTSEISNKLDVTNQRLDTLSQMGSDDFDNALLNINIPMVKRLIAGNRSLRLDDAAGGTLFAQAVAKRDPHMPEFIDLISSAKSNLNQNFPIMVAMAGRGIAVDKLQAPLKKYIRAGTVRDASVLSWQASPLFFALWADDTETFAALLKAGCDPDLRSVMTVPGFALQPARPNARDFPFETAREEAVRLNRSAAIALMDKLK